jgi:uncharacterized protein
MKYKFNPYNVVIPVLEHEEFLLYNTFSGGVEVLDKNAGEFLTKVMHLEAFESSEFDAYTELIEYFKKKEYVLTDDIDFIAEAEKRYLEKIENKANNNIFLTIGTTIQCNMGCAYCFEFVKPNNTLKDKKIIDQIGIYITSIIKSDPSKKWNSLNVTWYGGEPLINPKVIEELSPTFMDLCSDNDITYNASIITNGIYLTEKNIKLLEDNKVFDIQVTIDGARDVHNASRPLKSKNRKNYSQILYNLTLIPENFKVNIRINVDKKVADSIDELLRDLKENGIWPQRHKTFSFTPAWLRTYDGEIISQEEREERLTVDEFFDVYQNFRLKQIQIFNDWNVTKKAKLAWDLPSYQSDCPTWVSPYGIVIDPNGNIHKCWETIHDKKESVTTVFDDFKPESNFKKFIEYNRYKVNSVCRNCTYLPVCDQISCSHQAINNKVPQCTYWKSKAPEFIKKQYELMTNNPDMINTPFAQESINTGHTNK